MSDQVPLHEQDTSACAARGGKPMLLSAAEVQSHLARLGGTWSLSTLTNDKGTEVQVLRRQFTAKNFAAALTALNEFGSIAEAQQHHPNLHIINYRTVIVELFTFSVQGLALNDFIVAAKFDQCRLQLAKPKAKNPCSTAAATTAGAVTTAPRAGGSTAASTAAPAEGGSA